VLGRRIWCKCRLMNVKWRMKEFYRF